jgi:hypothetical protein
VKWLLLFAIAAGAAAQEPFADILTQRIRAVLAN